MRGSAMTNARVLQLGEGEGWGGSSPAEKDWGILVGDRWDTSQQCALAA